MIAFVIGCIVALPALRLKGVYLALVTLAVAVLFPQLMKWRKLEWLTNGAQGIDSVRYEDVPTWPIIGELRGREGRTEFAYWLAFVVLVIAYLVCRGIVKSRVGRSLVAIRDNETAAAVMGVNRFAMKTLVFGVSAAVCATAGSLSTLRTGVITPDDRYVTVLGSIVFLLVMVIGGAGMLWGPIAGGLAYVWLDDVTRDAGAGGDGIIANVIDFFFGWSDQSAATFILAVLLIVVMFVAPYGIVGLLKRLSRKIVVVVPPVGPACRREVTPTPNWCPRPRQHDEGENRMISSRRSRLLAFAAVGSLILPPAAAMTTTAPATPPPLRRAPRRPPPLTHLTHLRRPPARSRRRPMPLRAPMPPKAPMPRRPPRGGP